MRFSGVFASSQCAHTTSPPARFNTPTAIVSPIAAREPSPFLVNLGEKTQETQEHLHLDRRTETRPDLSRRCGGCYPSAACHRETPHVSAELVHPALLPAPARLASA